MEAGPEVVAEAKEEVVEVSEPVAEEPCTTEIVITQSSTTTVLDKGVEVGMKTTGEIPTTTEKIVGTMRVVPDVASLATATDVVRGTLEAMNLRRFNSSPEKIKWE